jgi:hypothetical protein
MSVQCDELLRLVGELPEEEVSAVLDDVRHHLVPWKTVLGLRPGSGQARAGATMSRDDDDVQAGSQTFNSVSVRWDLDLLTPTAYAPC